MGRAQLIPQGSPLRQLRHYPKMRQQKLRILLIREHYHLNQECRQALTSLGHEVVDVWLKSDGVPQDAATTLAKVLETIAACRPDMLLSINFFGFDTAHWMMQAVEAVGLPTAIWLVDSPLLILRGWLAPIPSNVALFVWDKSTIPALRALGASHVYHLPLAATSERLRPLSAQPPRYPTSFVGHSLAQSLGSWAQRLTQKHKQQAQNWAQELRQDPLRLHHLVPSPQEPIDPLVEVLGLAQATVSHEKRVKILTALSGPAFGLHIFGDPAWKALIPQATTQPVVAYGTALDQVFQDSAVNINITSSQMPSAVNQRVFDVPMAGGFLITDAQEELHELFSPDTECVSFSSIEELAEKTSYFARKSAHRDQIICRAQKRIVAEHLYTHRLARLVNKMRSMAP